MTIFPSRPNATAGGYRPDIDGLRAWAVISVILYHFGVGAFQGGFIGVDIFFVISGYLITKGVLSQLEKKSFNIGDFYIRRARRLFPALFVTISLTYIVCYFIFSPNDFMSMSGSTVYAITGISNIYFWFGSGYFDKFSSLKPLLHTWSLSVELQFYLIWPFLLIALSKMGKKFLSIGIVAFILIFSTISILQTKSDTTSAFFLTQYRMHEFAIGGIAVLIERLIASKSLKTLLYSIGLILVIVPVFTYDITKINFPGYFSLIPCIGSALLIIAGREISLSRLFSNRIASHIGEISYSLYLVHWPVFVFFSYFLLGKITVSSIALMLAVTMSLSLIMYTLVEKPLRNAKNSKISGPAFSMVCCMCAIILIIPSSSSWANKGWEWRFGSELKSINSLSSNDTIDYTWAKQKELDSKPEFSNNGKKKLLIIGDSQSADVINMLNETGKLNDYDVIARTVTIECGSPFVSKGELSNFFTKINKYTMQKPSMVDYCINLMNRSMDESIIKSSDMIIISMMFQDYNIPFIKETVDKIKKISNSSLYIVGRKSMAANSANIVNQFGRIAGVDSFAANYKEPESYRINKMLSEINGVIFINMMDFVCPSKDKCEVLTDDKMPIFYDPAHLTRFGAKYLGRYSFKNF